MVGYLSNGEKREMAQFFQSKKMQISSVYLEKRENHSTEYFI